MDAVITTLLAQPLAALAPERMLILGLPASATTQAMLAATRAAGTEVHLVTSDQVRFETNRWPSEDTARLRMHTSPSRSLLTGIGPFDVALIDVEPNWWTVARAIRAVVDTNVSSGQRLPVLLVANAGWPFGHRDAYTSPQALPEDAVQPYEPGGLRLGQSHPDPDGGFDRQRFHASKQGGPKNGVGPAIGDAISHVRDRYQVAILPGFHGLAVLWPNGLRAHKPEAADELKALQLPKAVRAYVERLEAARLVAETLRQDLGGVDALGPIPRGITAEGRSVNDVHALVLALLERSRGPEAVRLLQDAIRRTPDEAQLHALLGRVLMRLNQAPAALPPIRRAHELLPDDVALALEHGQIASRAQGNEDEAEQVIRHALDLDPDNIRAEVMLASHLRLVGQLDEARDRCRRVLTRDPDNLQALATLGHLDALSPEELDRADGLAATSTLASHERSNAHFALAKAFDRAEEWEKAFGHAKRANDLHKVLFQTAHGAAFDAAAHRELIDGLIATFTKDVIEQLRGSGAASAVPVVIGGLPRSGTTLTEQILASHPLVHGAGEVGEINRSIRRLDQTTPGPMTYPAAARELTPALVEDLAGDLVERFQAYDPEAERVTDKLPMNFLHLGLVRVLLPNAALYSLTRDPRDVFISSYLQGFAAPGLTYTCDQTWFAFYSREHDRVVAHWAEVIPDLMEVDYAELTQDQETWSRRLVDHAGLEWDPACLDFHRTKRPIHTASATQVRQPMFTSSVARWKHYEPWIDELLTGLEEGTVLEDPTPVPDAPVT